MSEEIRELYRDFLVLGMKLLPGKRLSIGNEPHVYMLTLSPIRRIDHIIYTYSTRG